jgi:hypothetical protein
MTRPDEIVEWSFDVNFAVQYYTTTSTQPGPPSAVYEEYNDWKPLVLILVKRRNNSVQATLKTGDEGWAIIISADCLFEHNEVVHPNKEC